MKIGIYKMSVSQKIHCHGLAAIKNAEKVFPSGGPASTPMVRTLVHCPRSFAGKRSAIEAGPKAGAIEPIEPARNLNAIKDAILFQSPNQLGHMESRLTLARVRIRAENTQMQRLNKSTQSCVRTPLTKVQ